MDLVVLLCLVIFITYVLISCILAYYFFRHRNIWNITFENIHLLEYFECPIHSIFWIPHIIQTPENCSICKSELNTQIMNLRKKELETIAEIYSLLKTIDTNILKNTLKNKLMQQYKMYIWLIQGTIKDYELVKTAEYNIYEKLKTTYIETTNHSGVDNLNLLDLNLELDLENITYLEYNIDVCNRIIASIDEYLKYLENHNNKNEQNECIGGYIFTLFLDILEYTKILNAILKIEINKE